VLVPLALFGLPERILANGATWVVKEEFHVTGARTPWLAQRAGVSLERAWDELSAAARGVARARSASMTSCGWCATAMSAR
jgi:hypothetical protein